MTEPPKMITPPGDAKFSFYASRKGATYVKVWMDLIFALTLRPWRTLREEVYGGASGTHLPVASGGKKR
jgi:hypothetical protein